MWVPPAATLDTLATLQKHPTLTTKSLRIAFYAQLLDKQYRTMELWALEDHVQKCYCELVSLQGGCPFK